MNSYIKSITGSALVLLATLSLAANAGAIGHWQQGWPKTDFSKRTIDISEVESGGPGKDGIPSIDNPVFVPVSKVTNLQAIEPVIGLRIGNEAKAYPLRVLMWHEIVNDEIAGAPVAVTYCPLCNTSIVFDRRLRDKVLDFGTTGNLRHSDLVMYDRQTESWWQQYGGEAIVGRYAGEKLSIIPSRLESFGEFRKRSPNGQVLIPNKPSARDYGTNPYVGYDQSPFPFIYKGVVPKGVSPMMRVVAVDNVAFTLPLVMEKEHVEQDGLVLNWTSGQVSALEAARIADSSDVGNVYVQRDGDDVPYVITFAFAFFAFHPEGVLHTQTGTIKGSKHEN